MATVGGKHGTRPKARHGARRESSSVRILRRQFDLSQSLLARLVGVSLRTISTAESEPCPPVQMQRGLTQISRLCDALSESMGPTFVGTWLDEPNEMLNGLKPVEAIERGEIDLVWQVVEGLRSGQPL